MSRTKRTLALDFDGVLHAYQGSRAEGMGEPIPGAQAAVRNLLQRGHDVVVFTNRETSLVRPWLAKHGFPALTVTSKKQPSFVIVDDRAICFGGEWTAQMLHQIEHFRPYWWTTG